MEWPHTGTGGREGRVWITVYEKLKHWMASSKTPTPSPSLPLLLTYFIGWGVSLPCYWGKEHLAAHGRDICKLKHTKPGQIYGPQVIVGTFPLESNFCDEYHLFILISVSCCVSNLIVLCPLENISMWHTYMNITWCSIPCHGDNYSGMKVSSLPT